MILQLFKIRFLQFFRLLRDIGLFRIIIVLLLLAFISLIGYNFLKSPERTPLALILIGIILLSVHVTRKDKGFLRILSNNCYFIFLSEYLLLTFPVILFWLIYKNWIGAGALVLLCALTPIAQVSMKGQNTLSLVKFFINPFSANFNFRLNVRVPIPSYSFEWISGIRKNLFMLLPVYILILTFSFKPYVAPVGLIFFSIILSGFYFYGEPREFIELFATNAKQFIARKIWHALKYLIIIFSPILLVSLIFQPHTWYYLAGAVVVSGLIQVMAIIFKYALFQENANLSKNSMIVTLNIFFLIVPLFWPVPLIMVTRYYFKAQKNLKPYFNA